MQGSGLTFSMGFVVKSSTFTNGWITYHLVLFLFVHCCLCKGVNEQDFTNFKFSVEPSDTVATKGSLLRLDCSVIYSKGSRPSIKWIKDGNVVDFALERRYNLASNGSMLISEVTDRKSGSDAGEYQCVATADGQTIISLKAKVQIAAIGRNFDIEPADLEVFLTDTAMFQCSIKSVPSANISWFKDNDLVVDRTYKYRTYAEGVLEIYNVEFRDFGNYHCSAEGVDKSRRSRDAKLMQKQAGDGFQGITPAFTLRPKDMLAMVGTKVILFCGAYGLGSKMAVPEITWLKDGRAIDLYKDGRVTKIGGGNLQILSMKTSSPSDPESDDAMYMCRAENDIDSVDAEAKLTVLVPPSFSKKPVSLYANENTDITLECQATGQPKPKISWYKNGSPVTASDYFEIVEDRSLRILGLVVPDSGFYQCFAENAAGSIEATLQLKVLQQGVFGATNPNDVPSEPKDMKAVIVSTRFITLSWGVPERTGPSEITAYSIRTQEIGSERKRVTNTTTQEVNIQRLKPNTKYEFRVSAFNRYGGSITPATLKVTTHEEDDVPSEAQNVQALPLSPTSINVKWDPPAQPKGKVVHYDLFYYPVGAGEEEQETIDGSTTAKLLTDLEEFVEYSFRIVASNSNGAGMSTEEVKARTFSDVPSDVPQNFTLETASSTSIVVRWQSPKAEHKNGPITGYKIRYKKKGAKNGLTVTTAGDRDLYALTDLKKDTNYQVRISAQTVNGSGPPTDWQYCETYKDDLDESQVPDMPDRLVVRATTNSLIVQWVPNRRSKYLVRGYYLGYGKGIPDVYRQLFSSNTFFYTIENLQPASEYVVSIRAFNGKGEGQPRYETVFTLEETAEVQVTPMLPPIGLKAIVLSAHTIVLTWTDNSLGKIQRITDNRYYTVRYNSIPPSRNRNKYVNSTDLNCHIDDLKPHTLYEFSVKVTKGRRKSTWSMSVTNETQEAAPGAMPRDLTPVPVEGNPLSVTLNWQPPQKPNGQITGYLVFYTTTPSQKDLQWVVEGVIGEKLSMTITDLTEDTTYYFKVQARNSKGYGPMSSTVIYKTPKAGGNAGGRYPTKNLYDEDGNLVTLDSDYPESKGKSQDKEEKGLSQNVMIIIIACVVGATFCIVVAVVTVILCRKRDIAERNSRTLSMYKGSPLKNKNPKPPGPPRGEGQPPDLWIDHEHLELKHLGKDERAESTISMASTRRNSHDSSSIHTNNQAEIYMSGSEAEERLLPPSYHQLQQQQQQQQRNIIRPKPLKIPVDAQGMPSRGEPVPTSAAYPNGHLMQRYTPAPNRPPSPSEDSGVIPMRPVYPRTQYQMQYGTQGPPRVNAGDIAQPPIMHAGYPMEYGYRLVPCIEEDDLCHPDALDDSYVNRVGYGGFSTPSHHGSLTRRGKSHHRTPITGIASPVVPVKTPDGSGSHSNISNTGSLGRPGNPLRSFSVPEPPGFHNPGTPTTPKHHIVKPQQSATPYKKQTAPISSGPIKPRAMMPPVVSPKSAPDVLKTGKEDVDGQARQKSLSTEELTAEMANLEGLMKDLNAITQQDFQC